MHTSEQDVMSNTSESQLAEKLVTGIHDSSSTEELILFVADKEGMLPFCQKLLEQYDHGESTHLVQLTSSLCASRGILPGALYGEVRKILLALNRFHDADRNHYEILYLDSDATIEEVKKAYRTLSKKYHPDSTEQGIAEPEKFLEISGAYHSIMSATSHHGTNHKTEWRQKRSNRKVQKSLARKKFLATVLVLVSVLAIASIFIAERYNNKAIISQLQTNAFTANPAQDNSETTRHVETTQARNQDHQGSPESSRSALSFPEQPDQEVHTEQKTLTVENILANINSSDPHPEPVHASFGENQISSSETQAMQDETLPPEDYFNSDQHLPSPTPEPVQVLPGKRIVVAEQILNEPVNSSKEEDFSKPASGPKKQPVENNVQNEFEPNKNQHIETINTTLEISTLLKEYSKYYNRKDLEQFLALFSENATENGHTLASEVDQYKSLFEHTRDIDLNIEDISWTDEEEGFVARGKFVSSYTYHDGSRREFTGDISFLLINELGSLKIQSLVYEFQ